MPENIATKTMAKLDNSLFSSVDKRHKKDISCNLLLLKILNESGEDYYAIKEFNNTTNDTVIRIPSDEEVDDLKSMLFLDGNKVCKYDISGKYLEESFDLGDICFVLFSKHVNDRTRTTEAVVNACGLLFLDIIRRRNSTRDIYIKLICSEARSESERVGLGTKFMNLAEKMGKVLKCNKVLLSSVDKPLGFYLSKDYKPVTGTSLYEIPEDIKIPIFKRGEVLQSSLPQKALFLNNMGMTTSYDDATRLLPQENNNRTLRRATVRESAGRRFLGNGRIGALSSVKLDVDDTSEMVVMEKDLTQQVYAQGKSKNKKTTRVSKKKRGKRGFRRSRRLRRSRRQ